MQNKINLDTHNELITVSEPWHRGSGFTWMLLALAGAIFFLSGAVAKAQFTFVSDNAGNYGGNWSNGSDGGSGLGAWGLSAGTSAGSFIGNPSNNGMGTTGIGTTAFGLFATGSGYVNASREFDVGMQVGDKLSFQWAMNWDASNGSKGFDLKSGGSTVFNLNNGGSSTITATTGTVSSNYGTSPMTVELTRTSDTQYSVSITRRDNSGTYTATLNDSSSINNFNFYAGNQNEGNGNRNVYFNNITIGNNGTYGNTQTESRALTGSGALTVNNNSTLTLTSNGNTFTGGTTIAAGSTLKVGNGGSTGDLSGNVANSGALTFDRTGETLGYSGVVSGSGTVTKSGGGQVNLTGANSYSGTTTVNEGSLEAQHNDALGNTTGNTVVNNGAALKIFNSGGLSIAENITLNGTGISGAGALRSVGGENTLSGTVTLNSNSRINSGVSGSAGNLTLSGAVSGGNNTLFLGALGGEVGKAGGNITVSGQISGAGADYSSEHDTVTSVFKDGVGALTLSANNNYSGATVLNSGTILVGNNSALGTGLMQVHYGEPSATKVIASTDGTARVLANTANIYGNLTLGAADRLGGITISGATSLGGDASGDNQRIITTFAGTSHALNGVVSGGDANRLIKEGAGTLALGNANTFTGGVQLNNGTLLIGNNSALGTAKLQVRYDELGTKTLASTSDAARTISNQVEIYNDLTLGQATGGTGKLTLSGNVALGNEANATRTLTVNGNHEISGAISGARGIVKQGGGELTLSGNNTSTGTIHIDSGTINLNGGGLGNGSIEVGGGAANSAINSQNATLRVTSGEFSRGVTVNSEGNPSGSSGARAIDFANTTGSATLSGAVALEKTTSVSVANGGTGVLSGALTGAGGIDKSGAGTLRINGTSSTGTITVNAGTLDYEAASGSSALTIASGGTLTGAGTTTGKLTVQDGGNLALGNSPGTMSVGSADWLGGGTYSWEINSLTGGAGVGWDLLDVNGLLDIKSTEASPFVIALISLTSGNTAGPLAGFDANSNYSFAIAYFDSISGFASNKFAFDTSAFDSALNGSWSLMTSLDTGAGGQDELLLTYSTNYAPSGASSATAIPEPSSAALTLLGMGVLALRRRCRR